MINLMDLSPAAAVIINTHHRIHSQSAHTSLSIHHPFNIRLVPSTPVCANYLQSIFNYPGSLRTGPVKSGSSKGFFAQLISKLFIRDGIQPQPYSVMPLLLYSNKTEYNCT